MSILCLAALIQFHNSVLMRVIFELFFFGLFPVCHMSCLFLLSGSSVMFLSEFIVAAFIYVQHYIIVALSHFQNCVLSAVIYVVGIIWCCITPQ